MLRRDNGKENIVESANVLTDVNVSNKFMPCFKSREDMVTERIFMRHQKLKSIFTFAKLCQVFKVSLLLYNWPIRCFSKNGCLAK